MSPDHDLPIEEYHRAGVRITNGDAGGYKDLYSRRDDVTLANPFGPPVRGWSAVSDRLDLAASHYHDGEAIGFENFSTVVGDDIAYIVEIETYRVRVDVSDPTPIGVRVTTAFRREAGVWRVTHRHGDPITAMHGGEVVLPSEDRD